MNTLEKFIERNADYIKYKEAGDNIIEKYQAVLPEEILYIWNSYGFGTFENGFIRFVNPDEYNEFLKYCKTYLEPTLVIAVTAMGDLIVWEGNQNATVAANEGNRYALFSFTKGKKEILGTKPVVINRIIGDKEFTADRGYFDSKIFYLAKETLGNLAFDECYGFEPLLALGGSEKISNLKIVKTREYLDIIGQAVDQI